MKTLENLRRLQQFLTRERWTQKTYARDSLGCEISISLANENCTFCLVGAIAHLFRTIPENDAVQNALLQTIKQMGGKIGYATLENYNDKAYTFDEIENLISKTIEREEKCL